MNRQDSATSTEGGAPAKDAAPSDAVDASRQDAGVADAGSRQPAMDPPPVLGPPGTWNDVTPLGAGLNLGEFGIQTMLSDPARPSDFYFVSSATPGVFKSTDYGETWAKISSFPLSYGCARDPDPDRDPETPLTLWCGGGYGNGVARSTDSGVTWTTHKTSNTVAGTFADDPYAFDVDPYDGQHLLAGFHGSPGLSESTNGGVTWTDVTGVDGDQGTSNYPYFIDTGNAASTRGNWLLHSQWGDGAGGGLQRSTNAGASWTRVDSLQHGHGNSQIFQAGDGVLYAAGLEGSMGHGVYRSADYGMSWTLVNDGTMQNGVFGTSNYIYADYGWATGGEQGQRLQRSPRNAGTLGTWESYAPNAMLKNGSGHAAVSLNPATGKWVIVIGAWKGGVYRYDEP